MTSISTMIPLSSSPIKSQSYIKGLHNIFTSTPIIVIQP